MTADGRDQTRFFAATLHPRNPCIICPDGITNAEGDDHYPWLWSDTDTCKSISDWAIQFDSGSDACVVYGSIVPECCPLLTDSPTSSPTTENPCIICPNGVTASEGDGYAPYATSGDNRTCAELIQEALTVESGTDDCGWKGSDELVCCKIEPKYPCIICPDGSTNAAGDDHVPGTWTQSCKYISDWAIQFETGTDACVVYGSIVPECCPLLTDSPTSSPTTENPCIICPNGVTAPEGDGWIPFSNDNRTCAELVRDALTVQSGTSECGWYEIDDTYYCCHSEPVIPCNLCPNGITADDDHVPESCLQTCKEISDMSQLYENGSDACGVLDDTVPECCPTSTVSPTTTFTNPSIAPPVVETQWRITDSPIVATTLAPTPASTASTGTLIENQCVICPHGPSSSLDDYAPYAGDGDGRTCAQLIQEALTVESGTDDCGWAEFDEIFCCYTSPTNPCIICPDGATAGDDFVPEIEGNTLTCAVLIEFSILFASESDSCRLYGSVLPECCPPSTCVICPNGPSTGLDDYAPYAIDGDGRTCAELIQEALTIESGTEDCGWAELNDGIECCYSEPANTCIICPDGVTASLGDDYVPEYDNNTATCADLITGAMRFESGLDACGLYDIDAAFCCPPGMTTPPTPTPTTPRVTTSQPSNSHPQSSMPTSRTSDSHPPSNPGEDNSSEVIPVTVDRQNAKSISAISISFVAGITLMALAVYLLRERASTAQAPQTSNPGGIVQMPEGCVTTAVAMPIDPEIDPETVIRPPSAWQMKVRPRNTEAPA
jgi:hypothetical protein